MERTERTIAVIGLGYVGLPVAAAFARCFRVVGFDIDTRRIAQLRDGIDSTREVAADALAGARLAFTDDASALRGCDFFIVAVPTPVDT